MDRIKIHGGVKLQGNVKVQGSKNAALPILAAVLLFSAIQASNNYTPNLNLKTILSVSVAIEPEILDTPARRSVNVIGISFKRIPD